MEKRIHHQQEHTATGETAEQFFRDIEIEFLIHELKDPIAVIETGLRTLLERQDKYGPLSQRQKKTLVRSLRNSKKARQMLNNLLEIGRSEAGGLQCGRFHPAESALRALKDSLETVAAPVYEEFRNFEKETEALAYLSGSGIHFHVGLQAAEIEMFQDEIKFRQIAGNLIKNALHHRKKRVEVAMSLENDRLVVDVTDDGPGVDPAHHELIFKRYAQAKECTIVDRKGHGLGLAGANILARCLGGDIRIISEPGQGATFRLTLPIEIGTGKI
jgi:signal transduction histidine kinase